MQQTQEGSRVRHIYTSETDQVSREEEEAATLQSRMTGHILAVFIILRSKMQFSHLYYLCYVYFIPTCSLILRLQAEADTVYWKVYSSD